MWTSPAAAEQAPPLPPRASVGGGKLTSQLAALVQTETARGTPAALAQARGQRLKVVGNRVRILLEVRAGQQLAVEQAVGARGGRVDVVYRGVIRADLPIAALSALAKLAEVALVRPPARPQPLAVAGQGAMVTGATNWHGAGVTGSGVKLGIIDGGFDGYTAAQASGDLPASLVTQSFCTNFAGTNHGTAVAEIAHEMAPGAQLYLICIEDEIDLAQAKDYALSQGITIVNHSVGWVNTSRGDGSGDGVSPDATVASARSGGILWVNAAGNEQQTHWSGSFTSADGDSLHDFSPGDELNGFFAQGGSTVCAFLKWDDWPRSANDYDLGIARLSTQQWVAVSTNFQTGTQAPTEQTCFTVPASDTYAVAIDRFSASQTPRFDLFVVGGGNLEYRSTAGSLIEPATSPNALAVGAVCWQSTSIEPFSSLGPTIDGRLKPDLVGPDSVSSFTYGPFSSCGSSGFAGTSASAPHVAGAAALLKQETPSATPVRLQSLLQSQALDRGASGPDNAFGFGLVHIVMAAQPCTISGSPEPGSVLTGSCPTPPSGLRLDLLWTRCSASTGTDCTGIAGATSTTYTVQAADVGFKLRLFDRFCDTSSCSGWVASATTATV